MFVGLAGSNERRSEPSEIASAKTPSIAVADQDSQPSRLGEFHPDQPIAVDIAPAAAEKKGIDVTAAFCDQMVHKHWQDLDPNNEGVLDKIETANLINLVLRELKAGSIDGAAFDAFFADFSSSGDGMVHQAEMASFLRDFI